MSRLSPTLAANERFARHQRGPRADLHRPALPLDRQDNVAPRGVHGSNERPRTSRPLFAQTVIAALPVLA